MTFSQTRVWLHVQSGSCDGTLGIKRSILKGWVLYSVQAVLHHLKGGINTSVLFFLYFAAGIKNFTVLASRIEE